MQLTPCWKATCISPRCGLYRFVEAPTEAKAIEGLLACGWSEAGECARCTVTAELDASLAAKGGKR